MFKHRPPTRRQWSYVVLFLAVAITLGLGALIERGRDGDAGSPAVSRKSGPEGTIQRSFDAYLEHELGRLLAIQLEQFPQSTTRRIVKALHSSNPRSARVLERILDNEVESIRVTHFKTLGNYLDGSARHADAFIGHSAVAIDCSFELMQQEEHRQFDQLVEARAEEIVAGTDCLEVLIHPAWTTEADGVFDGGKDRAYFVGDTSPLKITQLFIARTAALQRLGRDEQACLNVLRLVAYVQGARPLRASIWNDLTWIGQVCVALHDALEYTLEFAISEMSTRSSLLHEVLRSVERRCCVIEPFQVILESLKDYVMVSLENEGQGAFRRSIESLWREHGDVPAERLMELYNQEQSQFRSAVAEVLSGLAANPTDIGYWRHNNLTQAIAAARDEYLREHVLEVIRGGVVSRGVVARFILQASEATRLGEGVATRDRAKAYIATYDWLEMTDDGWRTWLILESRLSASLGSKARSLDYEVLPLKRGR